MLKATLLTRYHVLAISGAFLFGVFLMVDDELFTYMSLGVSKYEFPLLGTSDSGTPGRWTSASSSSA